MEENIQPQGEETQTPEATPVEESVSADMPAETNNKKSFGPIFGIIVIIVLLILAGFYFWGNSLRTAPQDLPTADEIATQADPALSDLATQETSDEIDAIEADLDATDLEGLDAELDVIDAELNF